MIEKDKLAATAPAILIALVVATFLNACTINPRPAAPRADVICQNQPQWYKNDDKGHVSDAVLVCFGADERGLPVLRYSVRPLTVDEKAAMAPKLKGSDVTPASGVKLPLPKPHASATRRRQPSLTAQASKLQADIAKAISDTERRQRIANEQARQQAAADRALAAARPEVNQ